MTMTSFCNTCGCKIPPGEGRYVTDDGVFCSKCGLPFPLSTARVNIVIIDPEHRLDQYNKEASHHDK